MSTLEVILRAVEETMATPVPWIGPAKLKVEALDRVYLEVEAEAMVSGLNRTL